MIAGHTFDALTNRCACGVTWLTIRNAEREDVGKMGIAHTGQLTGLEYEQITARRVDENARFDAAGREACA